MNWKNSHRVGGIEELKKIKSSPGTALRMVSSQVSSTGVLMATSEPAGEVHTGTFESQPPSAEEMKRRERMKSGNW